jgi:hypothetical protein
MSAAASAQRSPSGGFLERRFRLTSRETSVRNELLGSLATFRQDPRDPPGHVGDRAVLRGVLPRRLAERERVLGAGLAVAPLALNGGH